MRGLYKEIVKSSLISIGMAMAIFCFTGIVFDIRFNGNFSLEGYQFTKMVLGCAVIGLGFGIPSVVYRKDNWPMPLRVIIHMGTGIAVYTIVAHSVGWMGGASTVRQGILIACMQIAAAFVIWFFFSWHYRQEARKMNEKIQSMK